MFNQRSERVAGKYKRRWRERRSFIVPLDIILSAAFTMLTGYSTDFLRGPELCVTIEVVPIGDLFCTGINIETRGRQVRSVDGQFEFALPSEVLSVIPSSFSANFDGSIPPKLIIGPPNDTDYFSGKVVSLIVGTSFGDDNTPNLAQWNVLADSEIQGGEPKSFLQIVAYIIMLLGLGALIIWCRTVRRPPDAPPPSVNVSGNTPTGGGNNRDTSSQPSVKPTLSSADTDKVSGESSPDQDRNRKRPNE